MTLATDFNNNVSEYFEFYVDPFIAFLLRTTSNSV